MSFREGEERKSRKVSKKKIKMMRIRKMIEQCFERAFLKVITLTQEALTTCILSRRIVQRVERLTRNLKRHLFSAKNVKSATQRMSRQQRRKCHVSRSKNAMSSECQVDIRARP